MTPNEVITCDEVIACARSAESANANSAAEATLRVDDLAALAGRHPLTEANGADLLTTADLVRVMHKETSGGSTRLTERLTNRKGRTFTAIVGERYQPEELELGGTWTDSPVQSCQD